MSAAKAPPTQEPSGIAALRAQLKSLSAELRTSQAGERLARMAERRLRDVANAVGLGLLLVSPDFEQVFFLSDSFQRLFQRTEAELRANALCWLDCVLEGDREQVMDVLKREGAENFEGEFRVRGRDGEIHWIHARGYPIYDVDGELSLIAGISEDISERKRAYKALRESEERYRTLVEQASDAIFLTEADGRLIEVNQRGVAMMGYSEAELCTMSLKDLIPEEDLATLPLQLQELRAGRRLVTERRFRRKNGALLHVEISARALPDGRLLGITRDISRRKKAEEALRVSEERYALAVRGANDGLWDWNLRSDEVYYSPRWKAMLGCKDEDLGSTPDEWLGRVHPDDRDRLRAELAAHLAGHSPQLENEHRMRHEDGEYRWMLSRGIAVRDERGEPTRMAGSQTDITDRKAAEYQLLHDAFHDGLTNLPNRALFLDRAGRALQSMHRWPDYNFAILVLDVDRFKVINDSLGHDLGDQVLRDASRRLKSQLRPGDTLARLGGDEFGFLLEDIEDVRDATRFAERVQSMLGQPFELNEQTVYMTVSIGIVAGARSYSRPEDLLRDADNAMYRAKSVGKARHEVFDRDMHARAVALLQLESDLRRAVERHEFVVHYQPIVALVDRSIIGFEALVRWLHPERGLVNPGEFIPLAEETGLIIPLGRRVLFEACHQARAWQDSHADLSELTMSVNLSAKQFQQPNLVEQVKQALAQSGLKPDHLKLEITESALIDDAEVHIEVLKELRRIGVHVQLDDFGTGYSSLSYLTRFPVDALKIDRSFVKDLMNDNDNRNIVRAIVTMAHSLGMEVTAEGVETLDQLKELDELQCEYGQGFYFSKPIPWDRFDGVLQTKPTPS